MAPQGWVNVLNVKLQLTIVAGDTDIILANDNATNFEKLEELTKTVEKKRWQTFVMKPHIPALQAGGFLAPGTSLKMELHLNPNTIYLYTTDNKGTLNTKKFPHIGPEDIKVNLVIPKITLNSSVYTKLRSERSLAQKSFMYPVVRPSIRTFSIPTGNTTWEQEKCVFK